MADQLFGEDAFWNIHGSSRTFLKNYITREHVQKEQKLFLKNI